LASNAKFFSPSPKALLKMLSFPMQTLHEFVQKQEEKRKKSLKIHFFVHLLMQMIKKRVKFLFFGH